MRSGVHSDAAQFSAYRLYAIVAAYAPKTAGQAQVQGQALQVVRALADARRERLHDNEQGIPLVLWGTMFFTGMVTIAFACFFRVDNMRAHSLMILALSAVIGTMFALIAELDYPFRGDVSISPIDFVHVYERVHNLPLTYGR